MFRIIENNGFFHEDERRSILGVTGSLVDGVQQIKLIEFKPFSRINRKPVGNHGHLKDSNQWEYIVVLGEPEFEYVTFACRDHSGNTHKINLRGGQCVVIAPGMSLALYPIRDDAKILEISNMKHNKENYFSDILL